MTTTTPATIKLDGWGLPYWTGTWTHDLWGTFSSPRKGVSSYFMKGTDGFVAKDQPWVRQCTTGWTVVFDGTVLETFRLKRDAQRAAEQLVGINR